MDEDLSMNNVFVKIKFEDDKACMPIYQHETDAGADLYAVEEALLMPGQTRVVSTGFACEIPVGYEIQIRSRSGLAAKNNVFVLNSPGTIDCEYRNTLKVILHNAGDDKFVINVGDRIAQAVCAPVYHMVFERTAELSDTSRGKGGLGSTGV